MTPLEYMEVRGYADAAKWVYQQGLSPGEWTTGDLITLTEVRHVHTLAMSKVWEVAPHPDAGPNEGPGSFRQHNIQPFPGGMRPPDWPEVANRPSSSSAQSCPPQFEHASLSGGRALGLESITR